jgi:hypothetical protein
MGKKKDKKKKQDKEQLPVSNHALKIKYILDNFNFAKVQEAMVALNWVWQHMDDPDDQTMRVPTIERMKRTAAHLLHSVATSKERYFATGGFHAQRYEYGDLSLQFIVAEYDTCEDDM